MIRSVKILAGAHCPTTIHLGVSSALQIPNPWQPPKEAMAFLEKHRPDYTVPNKPPNLKALSEHGRLHFKIHSPKDLIGVMPPSLETEKAIKVTTFPFIKGMTMKPKEYITGVNWFFDFVKANPDFVLGRGADIFIETTDGRLAPMKAHLKMEDLVTKEEEGAV